MANEKRLIDANAFIKEHCDECKYFNVDGICTKEDPVCGSVMIVTELPAVDAVEVEDPELLKAIKLLIKQYARSKASDYVHSPVAHALYHTWKQVDERRNNEPEEPV